MHFGGGILEVTKIKQGLFCDHADADCGDRMEQWIFGQLAFRNELAHGQTERDVSPGDCRSSRAAIRLENIAIDPDCARSDFCQLDAGAYGAANQPLNLLRAPIDSSF